MIGQPTDLFSMQGARAGSESVTANTLIASLQTLLADVLYIASN